MDLDDILTPHVLNHSLHDNLIKRTSNNMSLVPNFIEIAQNAYYKLKDDNHKGGWLESDIDMIGLLYDYKKLDWVTEWKEVPFNESTLLVFEMKTNDSLRNRNKAIYQLNRHNELIQTRTQYTNVDGFYVYNVGTGFVMDYVELK